MPNGKPPKTTGEHLVSLYGYVTGFKKQIDHLHQDISKLESITNLGLLECLTWLSYETDLNSQNKVKLDG